MNPKRPVVRPVFLRWLAVICSIVLAGGYVFFSHALHAGRMFSSSKATSTLETLRLLDEACDKWAIENGTSSNVVRDSPLAEQLKTGGKLYADLNGASKDPDPLSTRPLSLAVPPPPSTPVPVMLPGSKSAVLIAPAPSLFSPEHLPK